MHEQHWLAILRGVTVRCIPARAVDVAKKAQQLPHKVAPSGEYPIFQILLLSFDSVRDSESEYRKHGCIVTGCAIHPHSTVLVYMLRGLISTHRHYWIYEWYRSKIGGGAGWKKRVQNIQSIRL